jgi:hypothetical protein
MDEKINDFGIELGCRVLTQNWQGVHEMLASWLRQAQTVESVREFFESEYRATLDANGIEGMHYPEYPEPQIGGNSFTTAASLREPISFQGGKVRPVAPEVTDENIRYWMKLELQCSDEQMEQLGFDQFAEVWMAVVETDEGMRVGYWSHGAY